MPSEWKKCELYPGLDGYADWAFQEPGRHYVHIFDDEGKLIPVLIWLKPEWTLDQFSAEIASLATMTDRHGLPGICLPAWYREAPSFLQSPHHLTALVTEEFFNRLESGEALRMIQRIVVGQHLGQDFLNDDSAALPPPEPPDGDPKPGMVVMGVIDDAIAFAHARFRWPDETTRVEYAWVQEPEDRRDSCPTVPYGREFTKERIDQLLRECAPTGIVDEDWLYRESGVINFRRPGPKADAWRVAHGTHVMDLACGYDPEKASENLENGQERPIVCVQLPAAVTADTSGAGLEPHVLNGIRYILDRADKIAVERGCGRLPVVINFSYGFIAGPHDGTHALEAAIDDIIEARLAASPRAPVAVVLPAGNSHLARCHAQVSFGGKDEEVTLDWRILPDDQTSTYLEIWLPYTAEPPSTSRIAVSIEPPGASCREVSQEGEDEKEQWLGEEDRAARVWKPNDDVLCKVSNEYVESSGRGRFVVAVLPTAFQDSPDGDQDGYGPPTQLAPSGVWKVKLRNYELRGGEPVHLWIQRDDTPHGYPVRGRQSYFEDKNYRRFDCAGRELEEDNDVSLVRRAGSMSAIATGRYSVVIGGYLGCEMVPAKYSAGGPITPQHGDDKAHRNWPDALAPSEASRAHYSMLSAGSRSGSMVAMNGTSVAAPQVARWIADEFSSGRLPEKPEDIREMVRQRAINDDRPPDRPPDPPAVATERSGWGRIRLKRDGRLWLSPDVPSARIWIEERPREGEQADALTRGEVERAEARSS